MVNFRIKEARELAGYSQKEIAQIIGVAQNTFHGYESGKHDPKSDILIKIANACSVTVDFLLGRENSKSTNFFSQSESEHIKKYRTLDEYGKEAVDGVLETEHRRCKEQRERSAPLPDENILPLRCSTQAASAGTGCYLGPEEWDPMYVQENDLTRRASFCVPVSGNSMEPRYHDGDILVIDDNAEVELGQVGLYTIDGEGFVKIYGGDHLISLNPDYPNIPFIEDSRRNGKVIGILEPDWIVEE